MCFSFVKLLLVLWFLWNVHKNRYQHFCNLSQPVFFIFLNFQVDHNVSRHLTDAYLHRNDWDMTILHYLGLDHIGHLAGPSSPLIRPKLVEMGAIIQKVKESLFEKHERERRLPPLILILGDHGMADVGGHGGASPAEVLVPLVAISPNINKNKVQYVFLLH